MSLAHPPYIPTCSGVAGKKSQLFVIGAGKIFVQPSKIAVIKKLSLKKVFKKAKKNGHRPTARAPRME